MQCDTQYPKLNDEDGFGLVEAVMATAVFLVLLVISIGPIMASLDRLDTARLTTEAEKLGEARLESIRALDFDDVGLTVGNPTGLIPPSITLTGDTAWIVETDITWEGAITGIDDANYKVVDVVVKHPNSAIDPISFSSIIAPDRLLDSSNKASVTVDLNLVEPTSSGMAPPQVFLIRTNGLGVGSGAVFPLAGVGPTQFEFPLLNPTDDNVGDPNFEMVMRLGPTIDDITAGGWHIGGDALTTGSDTFQLFEAQILSTVLPIYRPAVLEVFVEDEVTGLPIDNAQLTLFNGTVSENFFTTDGHFYIEDAYGYPLAPDSYDLTIQASGYAAETRSSVSIPSGYPTPLHVETFELEVQTGDPVLFKVKENSSIDYVIPNATISVPGLPDAVTDEYGEVTIFVPTGSHTATITNEVGFGTTTANFSNTSGTVNVTVPRPPNYRAVHLYNGGDGDHWGYRERWSTDDYAEVPRDYLGKGVFAVLRNNWYDVALICDDDSVGWQRNKWVNGTEWVSAGGAGC